MDNEELKYVLALMALSIICATIIGTVRIVYGN